jgi:hypothetical protein
MRGAYHVNESSNGVIPLLNLPNGSQFVHCNTVYTLQDIVTRYDCDIAICKDRNGLETTFNPCCKVIKISL